MIWLSDIPTEIVIVASREDAERQKVAASVTSVDERRIDRIGAPLLADYLRLVPTAAVSTSGPSGSLTEVRIRGAEADHSLLFVDGIRLNDPAAGNAPRFELLNADIAGRLEVVRGPQSALWGSESIGGVIAVEGLAGEATLGMIEAGSYGTLRASARTGIGDRENGLSIGLGAQRSKGVDSFDGTGDRDGYTNQSLRVAGRTALGRDFAIDGAVVAMRGVSEYDGYAGWVHGDTLDESRNRLAAGRIGLRYGEADGLLVKADASLLSSRNAYYLADEFLTAAKGRRRTVSLQAGQTFGAQRLIVALETEQEDFAAEIDADRRHHAATLEWRGQVGPVTTGAAIRRDVFSAFADATSLRASATLPLSSTISLAATYGEGITQPTFYDLFGYPGFSVGNRRLRPERSKGGEVTLRYGRKAWSAALTVWMQRLNDEIVADYSGAEPSTANLGDISRRKGVEAEIGFSPSAALRLTAAYAWLDAKEPYGDAQRVELRRPRHSGHVAVDGTAGRWSYGAMLARTGLQHDMDFDLFVPVRLRGYWLANGQLAYRLNRRIELTARIANAFDRIREDVVGYRSEGRSLHGGIRLRLD